MARQTMGAVTERIFSGDAEQKKKRTRTKAAPAPAVEKKVPQSFTLPAALADKLKDMAFAEYPKSKNVLVEEALRDYIAKREKKRGKPYPRRTAELKR